VCIIVKDHYHFFAIKKANPYISTEEPMPYATSEVYKAANKERFYLLYQTQAVAAAEVVSVTLNKDCNLVRVTITAGIATCRLRNAAAATVFDTTASASSPVSIMVGTNTNVLEITCSAAATLTISQMAVWGEFVSATLSSGSAPAAPASDWVRPADWLAMPTVGSGEQKFVGLFAVTNDASNYLALLFAGNYNVDWGDGTNQDVAANVRAEKLYDYATISAATESARGYRQVLVTVTPQVGFNLTLMNLQQRHSRFASGYRSAPWLDVTINGANFTSLVIGGATVASLSFLERVSIQAIGALSSTSDLFRNLRSVRNLTVFDTASVTNFASMYQGCTSALTFPLINTVSGTNFASMYNGCASAQSLPLINTALGTSLSNMYNGCASALTFPLINTVSGTNFASMYQGCTAAQSFPLINTLLGTSFASMYIFCASAQSFPLINTVSGTNFTSMYQGCASALTFPLINTVLGTNFTSMYQSCASAQMFPLINTAAGTTFGSMYASCISGSTAATSGARFAISFTTMKLSRQEIANIFTALGTASGAQTVTVTGNHGVPDLTAGDLLIATNKGWTVAS